MELCGDSVLELHNSKIWSVTCKKNYYNHAIFHATSVSIKYLWEFKFSVLSHLQNSGEHWKFSLLELPWTPTRNLTRVFFFLLIGREFFLPQNNICLLLTLVIKYERHKMYANRNLIILANTVHFLFTCLEQWQDHRTWILKGSEGCDLVV